MITIYTDGSSRGNPGPGGWGAIIGTETEVIELGGRENHTTNNRMELMACIKALEEIKKENPIKGFTMYLDIYFNTEQVYNMVKEKMKK